MLLIYMLLFSPLPPLYIRFVLTERKKYLGSCLITQLDSIRTDLRLMLRVRLRLCQVYGYLR